jgi:glycosyltransferase involved in cell wall biosynthesis
MDVSIIIPAYNEEKYIEKTLKAIKKGEIIVVCNGCNDKTPEIAKKYTNKVIILKEKGVSKARNKGAEVASHNRLVFLDADILVDEKVLDKIAKSKYTIGTCKVKPDTKNWFDKIAMFFKSYSHYFGTCTGLIFCDKVVFNRGGGFDEHLTKKEDSTFFRRAMKKGKFGIINAYVYNNMRRFRKLGYIAVCWYWIKEYIFPTDKEYRSIR